MRLIGRINHEIYVVNSAGEDHDANITDIDCLAKRNPGPTAAALQIVGQIDNKGLQVALAIEAAGWIDSFENSEAHSASLRNGLQDH